MNEEEEEGEETPFKGHSGQNKGVMDYKKVLPTSRYNNEAIVKHVAEFVKLVETGTKPEDAVALLIPGIPPSKRKFVVQKFVQNPTLRALVAAERERLLEGQSQEVAELNAEFVKKEYLDVYKEARANGDRGNALRALDALGRHFGMFVERSESRLIIDGNLNVNHETIDDDLRRLAKTNGVIIEVIDDAEYEEVASAKEVRGAQGEHGRQGTALPGLAGESETEGED